METKMDNEFLMTFVAETEHEDLQMFCGRLLSMLEPKQLEEVKGWFEVVIQLKKTKQKESVANKVPDEPQEPQQPADDTTSQEQEKEPVEATEFDFQGFDG